MILCPYLLSKFLSNFFVNVNLDLYYPYSSGCRVVSWSVLDQPATTVLKKTDILFSRNYQLTIVPQSAIGTQEPLPTLWHNIAWQQMLLWVYDCTGSGMSRRCSLATVLSDFLLLQSFYPLLHRGPWALWKECDTDVPCRGWVFLSHLLFAIWPLVSLCATHHLLHQNTSLVRRKSSTKL